MTDRLDVLFPGGKRVDVQVGPFRIATDQSLPAGGEASAPEPFDFFLASIAACAGIYALGFCQSRQIDTDGLGLAMHWQRAATADARAQVRLELRLPAGFPEKYKRSIRSAIELCAVKKNIQNAPEFVTEIVE